MPSYSCTGFLPFLHVLQEQKKEVQPNGKLSGANDARGGNCSLPFFRSAASLTCAQIERGRGKEAKSTCPAAPPLLTQNGAAPTLKTDRQGGRRQTAARRDHIQAAGRNHRQAGASTVDQLATKPQRHPSAASLFRYDSIFPSLLIFRSGAN